MKVVICGSMSAATMMLWCAEVLEKQGHEVFLPDGVEEYASGKRVNGVEGTERKIAGDLIRAHYELIKAADAILVVNCWKDGVFGYIGGNTLIEMGFAHVLGKKIFLLSPLPNEHFALEELHAMQPTLVQWTEKDSR